MRVMVRHCRFNLKGEPLVHWGVRGGGLYVRLPGNCFLFVGQPHGR
jgi:hypothetical protein